MSDTIQKLDFSVNLLKAILWQYNDATDLQGIIQNKQDWNNLAHKNFWESFITDIFYLRTANEFGLRVWAIILDMPLFVTYEPVPTTRPAFGFGSFRVNFGRGNFSSRTGGTAALPLEAKRLALRMRYFKLTSAGCIPEINRELNYLFSSYGGAYVLDGLDMTMRYVFRFKLSWWMKYIFDTFNLLPRPSAVKISYVDSARKFFGFGAYHVNFGRGNFGD